MERTARKLYRTRNDAKADVFDYIERFYNPKRRHSTIGYLSPAEFENGMKLAYDAANRTVGRPLAAQQQRQQQEQQKQQQQRQQASSSGNKSSSANSSSSASKLHSDRRRPPPHPPNSRRRGPQRVLQKGNGRRNRSSTAEPKANPNRFMC